ncbi:MAG TPA: hypothetical protein VFW45_14250 [Candidatus Polarisedimenticolia bacterium]|nr:hypothetical protein [Candidatus Polarisedimenticolia bacterium]
MRPGFRIPTVMAALLVLGPGFSEAITVERQIEQPRIFPVPVLVRADILMLACEPHHTTIRTTGSVQLPGLDLGLYFSSFETGSYGLGDGLEDAHPPEETPVPPVSKPPVSNAYLWVQFADAAGKPLSKQMFVGRCTEGAFRIQSILVLPVIADPHPGLARVSYRKKPDMSPGGPTALAGGLHVRFIFWSVESPRDTAGHLIQPASIDAKLLEAGAAFRIPKQPVAPSVRRGEQLLAGLPGRRRDSGNRAEPMAIKEKGGAAAVPST